MTAETPEASAHPDTEWAAPAEPVARGAARVGEGDEAPARGRASVPGAIDPALRDAPPYVPPPPRERPPPKLPWLPRTPDQTGQKPDIAREQSAEPPAPNTDVRGKLKMRRRGRGLLLPVAAGVLAAFVAGTGYLAIKERPAASDVGRFAGTPQAVPNTAAPGDDAPFAVPAEGNTADPFGLRTQMVTGVPTRLKVKVIGVDTTLETLHLGRDGALTTPKNFAKAGFWADGPLPGDVGPAVIAGHVDSRRGPAVFYKLREMQAGDRIDVVRGGHTVTFTVTSTAWYPKARFPTDKVYGPTPDRQLRLITCGGVFDRTLRSYTDNLVVYAVAG